MKNKILLLIIAFLTLSNFSYSQNTETTEFKADNLIGVWNPINNNENNNLFFEKKTDTKHKYGLSIEILKNGEFYSKYSAPCGNDSKLRTHNYNGEWILDEKNWIITTSKPINGNGTVFKIVELKSNKLILSEIKTQ